MCGRFETNKIEKQLIELFQKHGLPYSVDEDLQNRKSDDIRPTEKIMSILLKEEIYRLSKVDWGIKFSDSSPLIFNSRIETISEKHFWNGLLAKNKCLVPMTGFYEWKTEGKKKIKYRVFLPDMEMFFVPAIYTIGKDKKIKASLITTTPNNFIKEIHHRMPVIFDFETGIKFLNDDVIENLKRCVPYSDDKTMLKEIAD
ncbi:MAG: SOS response-associated peptidase [Melioribacteraceae bacterium]|nr:SOS response-associated peptidase [Melioribacteraceae bacterium]